MNITPLLTTGETARLLRVSETRVRQLADSLRLRPMARTASGMRLFAEVDVRRLAEERQSRS